MSQCPHGIDIELVWTPASPPNCQPCFDSLSADLDKLELDDPTVRDAAIQLADVIEKEFGGVRPMSYLELVTECEHGSMNPHPTMEGIKSDAIDLRAGGRGVLSGMKKGMSYKSDCPGGFRKRVEPDYLVAVCKEHDVITDPGDLDFVEAENAWCVMNNTDTPCTFRLGGVYVLGESDQ